MYRKSRASFRAAIPREPSLESFILQKKALDMVRISKLLIWDFDKLNIRIASGNFDFAQCWDIQRVSMFIESLPRFVLF